jgi:tetratricopeptide (TPR) repeat protein
VIETPVRSSSILAVASVVAAVTFLVFSGALRHDFLNYDDDTYVTSNPSIRSLSWESSIELFTESRFRSYTPLTFLSHGVDHLIWGMSPAGHHLTNLLLHSANAVWVFLLTMSLLAVRSARPATADSGALSSLSLGVSWPVLVGSAGAALAFSLHPAKVEAAAWVSDRKDLLMTFFLLPSILAYMRFSLESGRELRRRWYLVSLVCFLCAVLSKSVAVAAPLGLFVLDLLLYRPALLRKNLGRIVLAKIPFVLPGVILAGAAVLAATGHETTEFVAEMSPYEKALFPLYTLLFYPVKMLLPLGLTPIYAPPSAVTLTAFAVMALALTALALIALRGGRVVLSSAWLFYVVMILPTILGALSSTGMQAWADRYAYFPTISLFVLFGGVLQWVILRSSRRGRLRDGRFVVIGVILILGLLGFMSVRQLQWWRDSETLWRYVTEVTPDLHLGYNNLGGLYADRGDYEGAIQLYKKALGVRPAFVNAHNNLGLAYFALGRIEEAVAAHRTALTFDSTYVEAYTSLGNVMLSRGDLTGAADLYRRALSIDSLSAKAYYNLGIVNYRLGQNEGALACFRRTASIEPDAARAHVSMGIIHSEEGRTEMSIAAFRKAARLGSGQAQGLLTQKGLSW